MRFALELPMTDSQVRKRGLDTATCRLLISPESDDDPMHILSEFIFAARIADRRLVAQTIVCFDSAEKVRSSLETAGVEFTFDSDVVPSIRRAQNVVVFCNSSADVLRVVEKVSAEALVFYSQPIEDSGSSVFERLVACSQNGYEEAKFLQYQGAVGFFVFYQKTHGSIEILGCRSEIMSYFKTVCLPHLVD
jgi:hypothetical protein